MKMKNCHSKGIICPKCNKIYPIDNFIEKEGVFTTCKDSCFHMNSEKYKNKYLIMYSYLNNLIYLGNYITKEDKALYLEYNKLVANLKGAYSTEEIRDFYNEKVNTGKFSIEITKRGVGDTHKNLREKARDISKKCTYCGLEDVGSVDHIVPLIKGGEDSIDNIEITCSKCNRLKDKYSKEDMIKFYQQHKYLFDERVYSVNKLREYEQLGEILPKKIKAINSSYLEKGQYPPSDNKELITYKLVLEQSIKGYNEHLEKMEKIDATLLYLRNMYFERSR